MTFPQYVEPDHPQVTLLTPDNQLVDIDINIVSLITFLWGEGLKTRYSCQGGNSYWHDARMQTIGAYIMFDNKPNKWHVQECLDVFGVTNFTWDKKPPKGWPSSGTRTIRFQSPEKPL